VRQPRRWLGRDRRRPVVHRRRHARPADPPGHAAADRPRADPGRSCHIGWDRSSRARPHRRHAAAMMQGIILRLDVGCAVPDQA